jgi:endonuclease III-like uncharacterized protein
MPDPSGQTYRFTIYKVYIHFVCQGFNALKRIIHPPNFYGESAKRLLKDTIKAFIQKAIYDLLSIYDLLYLVADDGVETASCDYLCRKISMMGEVTP